MNRASYDNRFNLIHEYLQEIGKPMKMQEIQNLRNWPGGNVKAVTLWNDAKLHFRLRYYPSLEEVPEEMKDGEMINIREGTTNYKYYWNFARNKWSFGGDDRDDFYK